MHMIRVYIYILQTLGGTEPPSLMDTHRTLPIPARRSQHFWCVAGDLTNGMIQRSVMVYQLKMDLGLSYKATILRFSWQQFSDFHPELHHFPHMARDTNGVRCKSPPSNCPSQKSQPFHRARTPPQQKLSPTFTTKSGPLDAALPFPMDWSMG